MVQSARLDTRENTFVKRLVSSDHNMQVIIKLNICNAASVLQNALLKVQLNKDLECKLITVTVKNVEQFV